MMKNNSILITDEQISQIVNETIDKHISMLMEYSIPRSNFVSKAYNLCKQIIENWCLVHYCTLIGRTQTKDHWSNELSTHMVNIGSSSIKGNNSINTRITALMEGFGKENLPSNHEIIIKIIANKFKKEGFDPNSKEVIKCSVDCHEAINDIITVIAEGDAGNINQYIKTI